MYAWDEALEDLYVYIGHLVSDVFVSRVGTGLEECTRKLG
jgi:hypothetical protein